MAIELKQQVKLSQQLVMTPQLQQAIKLLQLNRLELQALVQQELQENPVLEETLEQEDPTPGELSDESPEERTPEPTATADEVAEMTSPVSEPEPEAQTEEASNADKIDDIDWQNYLDSNPHTGMDAPRVAGDDDRPSIEATLSNRETLTSHLEWQLHLSDLDEDEAAVARWVIGNIDDDGYLRSTAEEIARQSGADEELVERAIGKVQGFDPVGVGARDLRECLLLQLAALGIDDPIVLAIVGDHTDLLRKRDFRGLAKALSIPLEEVAAAARVIGQLEPWPGRAFGGDDPIYITPDIYVYKIGDDFHVVLNEDGLPKLRISNMYREVLANGKRVEKDTREYVHDKVRSAMWLIKSIHQRQRTIYKVMQSIIKYQREFFESGVQHLRPLNLRDVADDIGMHESTVSRVTTNKYVHTPQGIFELKYFFNSGVGKFDGDAVSSETVKEKIRTIIANEDPRRPLSDQRIAEMLKVADIDIARRTVTKYREAMNLLSSTKRRQIG
ncbi:MAG: RNA polymerase factor sigma-54 [Myxococcota bacterium]|nr:RNA polymerase factor sigma-54 [Myxococcales bacterium]